MSLWSSVLLHNALYALSKQGMEKGGSACSLPAPPLSLQELQACLPRGPEPNRYPVGSLTDYHQGGWL